jgi:hypothetical protein
MNTILTTVLNPMIRHGMTAVGGILIHAGYLDAAQSGNFTTIATGAVVAGIGAIWSLVKNRKKV